MFNFQIVGFALVMGVAAMGVDYQQQSQKADLALGEMSVGDYLSSYSTRFAGAQQGRAAEQAEKDRQSRWRVGGQPYLPEAPEGWTRRALAEGDDSSIMPYVAKSEKESAGASLLIQMAAREEIAEAKKRATRSWVYQRGDEAVFIEVTTRMRPSSNSLGGLVSTSISGMDLGFAEKRMGYGVIGGVGYVEKLDEGGKRKHHFRVLKGKIGFGDEVHIRVHANASRKATNEILSTIDYDGLNGLLQVPVASVGNDATVVAEQDEAKLALKMLDLRDEFASLQALEAQFRVSNINGAALVLNTYAQSYGNFDGVTDLTGGQVQDMGGLIEVGYRSALAALMQGKSTEEISQEVARIVDTAMSRASAEAAAQVTDEAETAPTMSPELARELGYTGEVKATLRPENEMAVMVLDDGASSQRAGSSGRNLSELDTAASTEAMIVSKSIDPAEFEAFKDEAATTGLAMELGLALVAKKFATENNLSENSCVFSNVNYRLECQTAQVVASDQEAGGILGLLGSIGGGTDAKPAAKPKRLQLSGGKSCLDNSLGLLCD